MQQERLPVTPYQQWNFDISMEVYRFKVFKDQLKRLVTSGIGPHPEEKDIMVQQAIF